MKHISVKQILLLQMVVIIYTISGIMAKFASAGETLQQLLLFFGLDLLCLGIYAVFWQQMIKAFPLSVAYANRAMALLWSAVWAKIIFGDTITIRQWLGIGLVIIGILVINTEKQEEVQQQEKL